MSKEYKTPSSFRKALEDRIKGTSTKKGIAITVLRKQVSFERLLARLFSEKSNPWLLKGGFAMQLRMEMARATKDVDLAIRDGKLFSEDENQQSQAIYEKISSLAEQDVNDFFTFIVQGPIKDLDAAPYGGARFHIEARLDGRTFEKFHLDVGVGDVWIEPIEHLESSDICEFAGLKPQKFPSIAKKQHFAEKLHAYTLPREEGRKNSRVKDLVDMILLIDSQTLGKDKLTLAIEETFKRRKTHDLPSVLVEPPSDWTGPFAEMASELNLKEDVQSSYNKLQEFLKKMEILKH